MCFKAGARRDVGNRKKPRKLRQKSPPKWRARTLVLGVAETGSRWVSLDLFYSIASIFIQEVHEKKKRIIP